jgi:hypothetical protein
MAKQPGSDWGSVSSFGGKVSSVFKGAGSGGARVRANTNAASDVAGSKTPKLNKMTTDKIQKNSVKKIEKWSGQGIPPAKKVIAKRATGAPAPKKLTSSDISEIQRLMLEMKFKK